MDFLFLTETWLSPDCPPSIPNSLTPTNYSLLQVPRPSGRGGGIAAIFKSKYSVTSVNTTIFSSFEHMLLRLASGIKSYHFLIVYRPPSSSKPLFLSDLALLLEDLATSPSELVAMGDFNIHLDDPDDFYSTSLKTLLETFDLKQHISTPTHTSGHILDLLITKSTTSVSTSGITDFYLSDHKAVTCKISSTVTSSPSRIKKTIRKISAIDIDNFSSDIRASSLFTKPESSLISCCQQFESVITTLLDKHAPPKQIVCRANPTKPFITPEIQQQKKERSRLESIFRLNDSLENETLYKRQAVLVHRMVTKSKSSYFKKVIGDNKDKPKKLWKAMDSLLSRNIPKSLPSTTSPSALASSFLNFFNDKITNLCSTIPSCASSFSFADNPAISIPPQLSSFQSVTEHEVRRIILSSSDSSCSLDLIPTKLLKSCIDAFVPPITHLINLSLQEGVFPNQFKHAIVTPLLKKTTLPKNELSNYRPISNLNFISKVLERVLYSRLCCHLDSFPSLSSFQSAYRKFYSTETALIRIHNDITLAMDQQRVSALVLLDLSAAFDTIDHNILLSRLNTCFGVSDTAHSLLSSYLSERSQSVSIDQTCSPNLALLRGVPQGSVLGPLLFTLYTTPLSHLLTNSSLRFHFYADDTQIYISFSSAEVQDALAKLTSTLDQVHSWFCANRLVVNPSKTEYLLIGTSQQRSKVTNSSISFKNVLISPTVSARNLGVIFDSNLDFKSHISSICRSSFFHIRQLRQIRPSLDTNSAIILANALVHSKIDYCNSLLNGLPNTSIVRLQYVQNALARVVCNTTKLRSHTSNLLKSLHWLPITQRIKFKIASLTFKVINYNKPSYLAELLKPHKPSRSLRSSGTNRLSEPDIRSSIGRRSFEYAAPKLWNSLPQDLRSCTSITTFQGKLKTHLFPP